MAQLSPLRKRDLVCLVDFYHLLDGESDVGGLSPTGPAQSAGPLTSFGVNRRLLKTGGMVRESGLVHFQDQSRSVTINHDSPDQISQRYCGRLAIELGLCLLQR